MSDEYNTPMETLMQRFNKAKQLWLLYKPRLQEAYEFSQPYNNKFYVQPPGQRKGMVVYDTTAMTSTADFTAKLQNALTPIGQQFMRLVPGKAVPEMARKMVDDALNEINDIVWKFLDQSNLALAVNQCYYDLAVGTGCLTVATSEKEPLIFESHPLCNLYLEPSAISKIQNVWRDFSIPGDQVDIIWPNAKVSDNLARLMQDANLGEMFDFAEGTIAHRDKNGNVVYEYVVFHQGTGEAILRENTPVSPWIIFRWSVPPAEVYGVGPVTQLMPTIKTLNNYMKFIIQQGQYALNPPLLFDNSTGWNPYNTIVAPGVAIPVMPSGIEIEKKIVPLNVGAQFAPAFDIIRDLRQQVTKGLFDDPLGTLQDPVRTATEMEMRQQAAVEKIGVAFGRLSVELLQELMKKVLYILSSKGYIPDIKIDGEVVEIEYQMPIVQAQGMRNLNRMMQAKQVLTELTSSNELSAASFDLAKLPLYVAEQAGIDTRLVKSEQQMKQAIQKIIQSIGAQQNAAA